jgi:hypothetical protein
MPVFFRNILAFSLATLILSPFINTKFQEIYGFPIYAISLLIPLSLSCLIALNKDSLKLNKTVLTYILCLLFLIIVNLWSGIDDKHFYLIFLTIALLPLATQGVKFIEGRYFSIYTILISFYFLYLIGSDTDTLIYAYQTSSRSLQETSPISITILAGISLITSIHLKNKFASLISITLLILSVIIFKSKGPILSLFLLYAITLAIKKNSNFKSIFAIVFSVTIAIISFNYFKESRQDSESITSRLEFFNKSIELALDRPFGGFDTKRFAHEFQLDYPHNIYIDLLINYNIGISILLTLALIFSIREIKLQETLKTERSHIIFNLLYIYLFFCSMFSFGFSDIARPLITLSVLVLFFRKNLQNLTNGPYLHN